MEVEKHIKKLVNPLKDEDELLESLKIKLTKKELKLLKAWAEGTDVQLIQEQLNLDEERYGELGRGFIEAHHLTPIAQLALSGRTRLSPRDDFAVVCANCHRMIHRTGAPGSFEKFKSIYS